MPRCFAILIGIDGYPPQFEALTGCARDVEDIATYLKENSGLGDVHIESFKSKPIESDISPRPPEELPRLPTYHNIKSSLERLTDAATTGDFVYVHFSGHGTTIPSSLQSSGNTGEDLALVLLENTGRFGVRYFHGIELATLLQTLVSKGVLVTLVLDCCFAGAVVRYDSHIRCLQYDPDIDAAYPFVFEHEENSNVVVQTINAQRRTHRGASMHLNWLINPDGYTILTACGPKEKSRELSDGNGQRHGILSYFLLAALIQLGPIRRRHRYLYSHICSLFFGAQETRRHGQNPMLYGNQDLSFFGVSDDKVKEAPIPVFKSIGGALYLGAGHAQGIIAGDRFLICPLNFVRAALQSRDNLPTATTVQVQAFVSELKVVDSMNISIKNGWIAIPIARLALRKYLIGLNLDVASRDRLLSATRVWPSLCLLDNDVEASSFYVTQTIDRVYEVRNGAKEVILNTGLTLSEVTESEDDLLDLLEHICMFTMVKDLMNSTFPNDNSPFRSSFHVYILDSAGNTFSPGCRKLGQFSPGCNHNECVIHTEDGEMIKLIVESSSNIKSQALYVSVYNLGEGWEIENILRSVYGVVQGRSNSGTVRWEKKLGMSASSKKRNDRYAECEDILKVFVSRQPTSFMSLELPALGKPRSRQGAPDRISRGDSSASEQWEALNFRIQTKLI